MMLLVSFLINVFLHLLVTIPTTIRIYLCVKAFMSDESLIFTQMV